jgi:hypothetical protein
MNPEQKNKSKELLKTQATRNWCRHPTTPENYTAIKKTKR